MGAQSLKERIRIADAFASGRHPVVASAFYSAQKPQEELSQPELHQNTLIPFPAEFTQRQLDGDAATEAIFREHEHMGGPLIILDGFHLTVHTKGGPFLVLIDTDPRVDPLLSGIIFEAKQKFNQNQNWNIHRKIFEIGMLCFGNWGQKRFPIQTLQHQFSTPRIVLGELLLRTNVTDQECALMSLGMQAVGQGCDIPITMHIGEGARYSPHCRGKGPHAWNLIQNADKVVTVDWTNYPPSLLNVFSDARMVDREHLYTSFLHDYGTFPKFEQEHHPPDPEKYFEVENGENPLMATRDSVVYWNDFGGYLGTCRIPGGWDTL